MLDGVRYLVVWNPLIFMVVSVLFHLFAPHPHHHGHGPPGSLMLGHNASMGQNISALVHNISSGHNASVAAQ